jgi:chromosome partitioning protein
MAVTQYREGSVPAITVAVANQKGGSGKTTSAVHLAAAIAELGRPTLLVDLDPQGHASEALGIPAETLRHELSDVLAGEKRITDIILPNVRPGLDLAPSNIRLSEMELTLVNIRFREHRVKRALEPVSQRYDYIILDCPPNLGLLTINALIAARRVFIPATSEYLSMLGVSLLLKTIAALKAEANPDLDIVGVLYTRYKARTLHAREVIARTNEELGDAVRVFDTPIRDTIRFAEASGQGKTVFETAPHIQGALAYREIAKEIVDATR